MKLQQISIFIENRSGRLAEITRLLAEKKINIRVSSLADALDIGILRLIVNDVEGALQALREQEFIVTVNEVIAIEVADEPGGLSNALDLLNQAELNIHYLYGFVVNSGERAIFIFRFDNMDKALAVLQAGGLKILSGEELYRL